MLIKEMKIVKDGPKIRVIVNQVDTSRPAVERDGMVYVFNGQIIEDLRYSADEFSKLIGLKVAKGKIKWAN